MISGTRQASVSGVLLCSAWLFGAGCGGNALISIDDGASGEAGRPAAGAHSNSAGGLSESNSGAAGGGNSATGTSGSVGAGGFTPSAGGTAGKESTSGAAGQAGSTDIGAGGDTAAECDDDLLRCPGGCVDPLISHEHCGASGACQGTAAGVHCPAEEVCQFGKCVPQCGGGLRWCGKGCVDTNTDMVNCGACASICPPSINDVPVRCDHGKCQLLCASGYDCDYNEDTGCESALNDAKNCGACGNACAAPSCSQGQCEKLVFVSSQRYAGNLGGLTGADSRCQALAQAAHLPGQFKAWLASETVSAASRLTHSAKRYLLLDGTVVANDWAALTSSTSSALRHAIDMTELGTEPSPTPGVYPVCDDGPTAWTGTYGAGQVAGGQTCNDWTDGQNGGALGGFGSTRATSSLWTGHCGSPLCGVAMHLYCLEQ